MKLIVGLGNPDKNYKDTRHNLGFMVIDYYAKDEGLSWRYSKDWMCYFIKTYDYVLIKPTTYMNRSGESAKSVWQFFKVERKDVLAIHDDIDLPFGKIRLALGGTSAGHHGVDSMIESLGSPDFARLKVGINHPNKEITDGTQKSVETYVLEEFNQEEKNQMTSILPSAREALRSYLRDGLEATMNRFN